jgi:L-lactate dehydrogenase complex protein LldG
MAGEMTEGARHDILARIRGANAGREAPAIGRHPIPARARGETEELLARFRAMAEEAGASLDHAGGADALPGAVASFLDREGLGRSIVLAAQSSLRPLAWAACLEVSDRPVEATGTVAVTTAFAGIAETGTLMVHSGPRNPNRYHFVAETHVAVLATEAIVGGYEDAWSRLEARFDDLPRSVTLITGPSRSSDIERKLQIGVHGPRRLHIVLYDGQEP